MSDQNLDPIYEVQQFPGSAFGDYEDSEDEDYEDSEDEDDEDDEDIDEVMFEEDDESLTAASSSSRFVDSEDEDDEDIDEELVYIIKLASFMDSFYRGKHRLWNESRTTIRRSVLNEVESIQTPGQRGALLHARTPHGHKILARAGDQSVDQ